MFESVDVGLVKAEGQFYSHRLSSAATSDLANADPHPEYLAPQSKPWPRGCERTEKGVEFQKSVPEHEECGRLGWCTSIL